MITVLNEGHVAVISSTCPFGVTVVNRESDSGVLETHLVRLSRTIMTPNGKLDFMALLYALPVVRYDERDDALLVVTREGDTLRLKQVPSWEWFDQEVIGKIATILSCPVKTPIERFSEEMTGRFGTEIIATIDAESRFRIKSPGRRLTQDEKEELRNQYISWLDEQR